MRLTSFQVRSFRSINDSTPVELALRTVLVGRNESGKTALLRALHGVKSQVPTQPGQAQVTMIDFTMARDFPRDRERAEFDDSAVVTETKWDLSDNDRAMLGKLWPRAAHAMHARVERLYKQERIVHFENLTPLATPPAAAVTAADAVVQSIKTALAGTPGKIQTIEDKLSKLIAALASEKWDDKPATAAAAVRAALPGTGVTMPPDVEQNLLQIETVAANVKTDDEQQAAARKWLQEQLPVFVYLDEWDWIPGQYNISTFLTRKQRGLQPADVMFEKLLKVADLRADELQTLLSKDHQERTLLTDRASRVFTRRLRELWKDRKITVQFRVDADYFDVVVSDDETESLVNLDERSRGFRWYFSFYVAFCADTMGGDKANAILLLDEPGLFLHATAQAQLLRFFESLSNQIVYTTHSPFMIDPNKLGDARTVNLDAGTGTVVSSKLVGDDRTLFPLQAALGYDITQTLFVGARTVVIEGVADYWYLNSVSDYVKEQSGTALQKDIVLTPAGGAQKIPYMVALLTAQNLRIVVLFDHEPEATATIKDLETNKLIRSEAILKVSDAFSPTPPKEADIEDLIDPAVFAALVNESYAKELKGKTLPLNANIPRIVIRYEKAFEELGMEFQKSRPARLFMNKMGSAPASVLTADSRQRFERLFGALNAAVKKIEKADRPPFK